MKNYIAGLLTGLCLSLVAAAPSTNDCEKVAQVFIMDCAVYEAALLATVNGDLQKLENIKSNMGFAATGKQYRFEVDSLDANFRANFAKVRQAIIDEAIRLHNLQVKEQA